MIAATAFAVGFTMGLIVTLAFIAPWLYVRKADKLRDASVVTFKKEPVSFRCGYARALDDMTEDMRKEVP